MSADKYKKLTQREHVLLRKNMYCGDPNNQSGDYYVVDDINELTDIKIKYKKIEYNSAFLKLFDEVISNASDASIRYNNVSYIKVWIDQKEGSICVENDCIGGIPVEIHPTEKMYIGEMIFSEFLTGENYDDNEQKILAGQNGLGIKLVNVLSSYFKVEHADGKKSFKQEYFENLSKKSKPVIKESNKNFVRITYKPDFNHFNGIDYITDDMISIMLKRIVDLSVYNPKVKFYYNDKQIKIKSIKDWMKLHLDEDTELYVDDSNENWIYGVAKSPLEVFTATSIASSVSTYRSGTHVNYLSLNLSKAIADSFSKKIKANWVDVKNKMMLFLIAKIPNPTFDSQTKECLTNQITKEVLNGFEINPNFVKKLMKSEIVQSILDAIEQKEKEELKRLQKNQQKMKVKKLIDANGKDRSQCRLFIFEGESAGDSARIHRNPSIDAVFKLKGKFMNTSKVSDKKMLQDEKGEPTEAANLINSLGLELNKKPDRENLRFGEILIATDMDCDGDSISGLLFNFFSRWKEIFEWNMVYRVITPLLVIKKAKVKKFFYTQEEWEKYQEKNSISGWEILYKKGLGSLEDDEYQEMIQNPRKVKILWDDTAQKLLECWFSDNVELRKEILS